jgi:hypothetical protein
VKDERAYLLHAIEAIDAISSYTVDGSEAFFSDGKTQDAVIRNIEIIGQAVKGISDDTRALEPAVPWRQIAGYARQAHTRILWCRSCARLGRGGARTAGLTSTTGEPEPTLGGPGKLCGSTGFMSLRY